MKPFWLNRELMDKEQRLLQLCLEAHAKAALFNQNPSSMMVAECARGSMNFTNALMGGLLAVGGVHAPLVETWNVLVGNWDVDNIIKNGGLVPGWGSSFDGKEWEPVAACLNLHWPDIMRNIDLVTGKLETAGKTVKPNASTWTAAVGIALQMPPILLPWLFVTGRLDAWSIIILNVTAKKAAEPPEESKIITN